MRRTRVLQFRCFAVVLLSASRAQAQQLQKFTDCKVGMRVSTNDGRKGTISRLDTPWSYCWVKFDDGTEAEFLYSLLNAEGGKSAPAPVGTPAGGQRQRAAECTIGMRVSTNDGRKGVISRVDRSWSYCYVRFPNGKEEGVLYSLLNSDDGSGAPGGAQDPTTLAVGAYECTIGENTTTMIMRITGATTYSTPDGRGTYRMDTRGTTVFDAGPLKVFHSKLLSGGRIGMNQNGGTFYNVQCALNKNLK